MVNEEDTLTIKELSNPLEQNDSDQVVEILELDKYSVNQSVEETPKTMNSLTTTVAIPTDTSIPPKRNSKLSNGIEKEHNEILSLSDPRISDEAHVKSVESQTLPMLISFSNQTLDIDHKSTQSNIGYPNANNSKCCHRRCVQFGSIIAILFLMLGYLMHDCTDRAHRGRPGCC